MSPGGNAVVTWAWGSADRDHRFRVQAAYRPAGERWRDAVDLTPANGSEDPVPAIDGRGEVLVVNGSESVVMKARRRVVGRGWLPEQVLGRAGERSGPDSWDVAASRDGDAVVVYTRYDHGRSAAYARHRPAAGPWGDQLLISPADIGAWAPSVVMDASGTSTAVWSRTFHRIDAVRRPPAGPWGSPRQVVAADPEDSTASTDANDHGDVLVTWQRYDTGVMGAYRPTAGDWTDPFRITPLPGASQYRSAVALGDDGAIVAVWIPGQVPGPVRFRAVTP